jgi:hypothetical protein
MPDQPTLEVSGLHIPPNEPTITLVVDVSEREDLPPQAKPSSGANHDL